MPSFTLAMAPSGQFCILCFITWPLPGVPSAAGQVGTGDCFSPSACLRLHQTHSASRQPHSLLTGLLGACLSPLSPHSVQPCPLLLPNPSTPQHFHTTSLGGFQTLSWLKLIRDAPNSEEEPPKATAQSLLGMPMRAFPKRTSRRSTAVSQGLGSWTD